MSLFRFKGWPWLLAMVAWPLLSQAVVINEIFYRSPYDLDGLEFVELHNPSDVAVDLEGWTFSKGIDFVFPKGARLNPGGFFVICRDADLFEKIYGREADAVYEKALSNGGETVTLKDARDRKVDSVKYDDEFPWPKSADGYSASLERICPGAPGADVSNWAPSLLSDDYDRKPSGTPGERNSVFSRTVPPVIEMAGDLVEVIAPGEAITVRATVSGAREEGVALCYRVAEPGHVGEEVVVPMRQSAGAQFEGTRFEASIPGTKAHRIVRFRVRAMNEHGDVRFLPHPHALRPAYSVYVKGAMEPGKIPVMQFIHFGEQAQQEGAAYLQRLKGTGGRRERFGGPRGFGGRPGFGPRREGDRRFGGGGRDRSGRFGEMPSTPLAPQGASALVYTDSETGRAKLFDFINITPRKSGYKVRLHKDRPLNGLTTVNVLYEHDEATFLNEALAYELYRRAGNATVDAGYVRVMIDGALAGHHVWFEQPNGNFFRRHDIDDGGNLYKLIWMGSHRPSEFTPVEKVTVRRDIVGRHEKKSNLHEGYEDLVQLIEALEQAEGEDEELWELIQARFDVDQVVNYFAVNSLLSHWDGFFNNYFLYHDHQGAKRWTLYPWDQDSTWSQRMGSVESLSRMPLNFGAEGARPPGAEDRLNEPFDRGGRRGFRGFGGGRGGPGWWRDGGEISKPLLANPSFYARFTARLKELAEEVFSEKAFGGKIDETVETLLPEVRLRAKAFGRDEAEAEARLRAVFSSMREHMNARRAFVLEALEEGP